MSRAETELFRALIAEDDPGIRKLMASLLEIEGWDVREASDGAEAVEMAKTYHPHALVTDVMMPNKDGLDAALEIRMQNGNEDIAVVVVTAYPQSEERAGDVDDAEFITKPFDSDDLTSRTREAVERSQRAASST